MKRNLLNFALLLIFFAVSSVTLKPSTASADPVAGAVVGALAVGDLAGGGASLSTIPTTGVVLIGGVLYGIYKSYQGIKYIVEKPDAPEEAETHVVTFCQGFDEERMEYFFAKKKSIVDAAENFSAFKANEKNPELSSDVEYALALLKSSPNGAQLVVQLLQIKMSTPEIEEFLLKSVKKCL